MKNCLQKNYKTGFTLAEILVTVAIIAILASIVLASLHQVRSKSRDTQRKSDLHQIVNALQTRYIRTGSYAIPNAGYNSQGSRWFNYCIGASYGSDCMDQVLVNEGYMAGLAHDPLVERNQAMSSGGHNPYMRVCRSGLTGSLSDYCNVSNVNTMCMTAQLENPTVEDMATIQNSGIDAVILGVIMTTYKQNYAVCLRGK